MVKIISDNCCDLPRSLIDDLGITLVHMMVRFGVNEYHPNQIDLNQFYQDMKSNPVMPTTSQPSLQELKQTYENALEDGSDVIAIHLSSGMSGTVGSAELVRQDLANKERLYIIDSKKASVGQGLMVLEAARMAKAGADTEDILNRMREMQQKLRCIFTIDKLDYLVKGGRASKTLGIATNLLDIKVILHVDPAGCIVPFDKARGHKSALKKIINTIKEEAGDLTGQTAGISHADNLSAALYMKDVFMNELGAKEVIIGEIGPVVGSHVGPGTISLFFEVRG